MKLKRITSRGKREKQKANTFVQGHLMRAVKTHSILKGIPTGRSADCDSDPDRGNIFFFFSTASRLTQRPNNRVLHVFTPGGKAAGACRVYIRTELYVHCQ
jgi:hypothetical protein